MELDLLRKFDAKTNRVKGLAFHPHRPWILASLHNGIIQLYDYRMEILLESFEEHEGPVRGIDFHKTQPLFVSGGDDYKVKVWNYQNRRCLYTLHGHLDYIRTVYFHPNQYPWILSASDDQTVRIWNWQSRTCLLVLTGHNHYVMCAQWHPTDDLILSASLDQTIRVWDISGLRKRSTSIVDDITSSSTTSAFGSSSTNGGTGTGAPGSSDVFGNVDAVVKFVLEGHSRGVNWASFHPTMSLVVSGADDREIKVWRMSGSRAWETTTYRGHLNNVSCVLFHAKENIIISNSEDKTLRVWDVSRNHPPLAFRRDSDRYWILAAHPRLNLLAAGHDNGMLIFKLSRERPAFYYMPSDEIYYFNEGYIRIYRIVAKTDKALMPSRGNERGAHTSSIAHASSLDNKGSKRSKRPRFLLYNPYQHSKEVNILMFYESLNDSKSGEDSEYELYVLDRKGNNKSSNNRSSGMSVAFVTRNRFAVLCGDGTDIILKNMENISKKKIRIPDERRVNYIFEGGINRLILRCSEFMTLFDVQSKKIIHELQIPTRFPIKFVDWDKPHYRRCALLAKFSVMICDSDLNDICTIYENAKVKSGAWSDSGQVYIYTTVTHMKYALPSGDAGIIKTLDQVLYIASIHGNIVTAMTRDWKMEHIEIDDTEFVFKKALTRRKFSDVRRLIENDKLRGESILAYLQKKGYPEVALRFVQDPSTRFELAIECGNIDDAFECCREIDTDAVWNRFAEAALMQGNYRYVTEAYKQTFNFEKLMNLFVINGNFVMLNKLQDIAKSKEDDMMLFNIAMFNGNERDNGIHVIQRIECLKKAQQYGLAYLTAKSNGLQEIANQIKSEFLSDTEIIIPEHLMKADKFSTPNVYYGPFDTNDDIKYDWPQLPKELDLFDQAEQDTDDVQDDVHDVQEADLDDISDDDDIGGGGGGNGSDDDDLDEWGTGATTRSSPSKGDKKGASLIVADDDDDFKLTDDEDDEDDVIAPDGHGNEFVMPYNGKTVRQRWLARSIAASDMIASGSFDLAQESLHRQFGIVNFSPLKVYFLQIYASCNALMSIVPNASDIGLGIRRDEKEKKEYMAAICLTINECHEILKEAYLAVTGANFDDAISLFRKILHIVPLLVISSSDELRDVRNLIHTCSEYINALRVKIAANECGSAAEEKARQFELNCYFTHFELEDAHIFSALYGAMKLGYKASYFKTTAVLCRRLLELAVSGKVRNDASQKYIKQVEKVLKKCEAKQSNNEKNNEDELRYKAHDFTYLCSYSLTPIERNDETVKSSYCQSVFKAQYNGELSPVCNLVRIGGNHQGVTINTK